MPKIKPVVDRILSMHGELRNDRSLLVAVSGIDASGKGYTTRLIVEALRDRGKNAVGINLDAWLNLPGIRFGKDQPGEHFYRHGFRFQELFEQLILPLKQSRSIRLDAQVVEEPATEYLDYRYEFDNVDVIVLEGVFLLQPAFRNLYDLAVWVECSFETAIERAIVRGKRGSLPQRPWKPSRPFTSRLKSSTLLSTIPRRPLT